MSRRDQMTESVPSPSGTVEWSSRQITLVGRWLIPGLLCLFLFMLALGKISGFDYWTHLHQGRTYLSTWSPADFAALVLGEPANAGLFQILLYQLYTWGGHSLVGMAVAGIFALTLALFLSPPRRESSLLLLLRLLLVLLAAKVCLNRLMPRPELLGYLFFALAAGITARWLDCPRWLRLVLLAVVLAAWLPVHQTVYPGLFFLAAVLLLFSPREQPGAFRRQWSGRTLLMAAVAVTVLAVGYPAVRFVRFVFRELGPGGVLSGISEMRPTWEFPGVLMEYLLLAGMVLLVCWYASPGRWRLLLLLLPVLILGLVVVRNTALAALAMLFLGLRGLDGRCWSEPGAGSRRLALAVLLVANVSVAGWLVAGRHHDWGLGLAAGAAPVEATRFVATHNLPGPVFNNLDCGGYLLWAWQGQPVHFIDGRLGTVETLGEHDLLIEAREVRALFDKHRIHTVLIQPFYWNSGRIFPLVLKLMLDPAWSLVHASDALVFVDALPPGMSALPKAAGWQAILAFADDFAKLNDQAAHLAFSRGVAWQGLGDFVAAQQAFAEGIDNHPELAGYYRKSGLAGRRQRP